jgi:hypothetical protein
MTFVRRAPYSYDVVDGQRVPQQYPNQPVRVRTAERPVRRTTEQEFVDRETMDLEADSRGLGGWKPLGCVYWIWGTLVSIFVLFMVLSAIFPWLHMDPWVFVASIFAVLFLATGTARFAGD